MVQAGLSSFLYSLHFNFLHLIGSDKLQQSPGSMKVLHVVFALLACEPVNLKALWNGLRLMLPTIRQDLRRRFPSER
jgi:hypothetical protein